LRDEYPPEHWPACARKLQLAAEAMDEAAVSTIHAWCHRMLREHAFDSDSLFTQTLETDQRELLAEVVRDYWRSFLVPLDAVAAAEVRQWWAGPEALQRALGGLLAHAGLARRAAPPARRRVHRKRAERERRLAELKAPWGTWADELQTLLEQGVAGKRVDGRKLRRATTSRGCSRCATGAMIRAAVARPQDRLESADAGRPGRSLERDAAPPSHPALTAIAALPAALAALPDARDDVLCHAARWVAGRFAAEQARRAQMGFDDLLTRLDAALHGPMAGASPRASGSQFPVALIDEFQDTDPVQYRIFDAVYRLAQNSRRQRADPDRRSEAGDLRLPRRRHPHLSGGPPRLRRAALHAEAGTSVRPRPWSLATNRCFRRGRSPRRRATALSSFAAEGQSGALRHSAEAQGRARTRCQADGVRRCPHSPSGGCRRIRTANPWARPVYREQMAASCAGEMVRLLNLGQAGQAGFAGGDRAASTAPGRHRGTGQQPQ
jgi:exodeoxyribonuclease V beta subunit